MGIPGLWIYHGVAIIRNFNVSQSYDYKSEKRLS